MNAQHYPPPMNYDEQGFAPPSYNYPVMPMGGDIEGAVRNVIAQIDPQQIIDNLNHALKGEWFSKERGEWIATGRPLVNDACRTAVINYMTPILSNTSTMGHISEQQFSYMMESIIDDVKRLFIVNLEEFGFVPPGEGYSVGIYYNRGTPDSSRMTAIANMIFRAAFIVLSRSVKGIEARMIFKSLSLSENMGGGMGQPQRAGLLSRIFGGGGSKYG